MNSGSPTLLSAALFLGNVLLLPAQQLRDNTIDSSTPANARSGRLHTLDTFLYSREAQPKYPSGSLTAGSEMAGIQEPSALYEIPHRGDLVKIGEKAHGGIVFYVDSSGIHGLAVSLNDIGPANWGNNFSEWKISTDTCIGCGKLNTVNIISAKTDKNHAAWMCENLESEGFSDWYLPSINELELIYRNIHLNKTLLFADAPYWSSSQDEYFVWLMDFRGGKKEYFPKKFTARIRAIRSF